MSDPLALARMRTLRTTDVPVVSEDLKRLHGAADEAGRTIIDFATQGASRALLLSWDEDYNPGSVFGADTSCLRPASPTVLLTLAACIGCCWTDPNDALHPGQPASEGTIFDALSSYTRGSAAQEPTDNQRQAWKAALRRLHACGLVVVDPATRTVRLGPEIATWSAADVSQLRSEFEVLPGTGGARDSVRP